MWPLLLLVKATLTPLRLKSQQLMLVSRQASSFIIDDKSIIFTFLFLTETDIKDN